MDLRKSILKLILTALCGGALAAVFGFSYTARLSSHSGYFQVSVTDPGPDAKFASGRPRQTAVVVMDGLGYKEAQGMRALQHLGKLGQCRKTNVGTLSMSRPVYAVLSTGLEQDRTGARNNDDESPLAAQSIWELAHRAGLSVSGTSELSWWRELFPQGFTNYVMPPRQANFFVNAAHDSADLLLIHHVYIDEAGHDFGAGSPQYKQNVLRADEELEKFIDRLDLSKDLIVVTADHGHSLRGGHGGQQDRVVNVLTCYAGAGVLHQDAPPPMRTTAIAPSLALFLRLPFPAQMQAGKIEAEDDLDTLGQLVDRAAFSADYLHERQRTIESFRAQNQAQLSSWMPDSQGSWKLFYAGHREARRLRLILLPILVGAVLLWRARRGPGVLTCVSFLGMVFTALYALQVILRGSFDMTSIDSRHGFLTFTSILSAATFIGALILHVAIRRSLPVLILDLRTLLCVAIAGYVMHPIVFGYQVGFPLPAAPWFFFPYFATLALFCLSVLGLLIGAAGLPRSAASSRPARRG